MAASGVYGRTKMARKTTGVANRGLTLLEILVSSILLALIVASSASIFIAAKRLILHSRNRVTAAEAIKFYLEPLQMQVSAKDWSSNCLGARFDCVADPLVDAVSFTTYTPTWAISDISFSPTSKIRKVSLTLQWDEKTAQ